MKTQTKSLILTFFIAGGHAFTPSTPRQSNSVAISRQPIGLPEVEKVQLQNVGEMTDYLDTQSRTSEDDLINLSRFALFQDILPKSPEHELNQRIASKLDVISLQKGDVVVAEGDIWDSTYFVASGEFLEVDPNTKAAVETLKVGDSFGAVSLICDNKRSKVEIKSLSNRATLYKLKSTDFNDIVDDDTFTLLGFNYLKKKIITGTPYFLAGGIGLRIASSEAARLAKSSEAVPKNDFFELASSYDPSQYSALNDLAAVVTSPQAANGLDGVLQFLSSFNNPETIHAAIALGCFGLVNSQVMKFLDALEEKDEMRRQKENN